MSVKKFFAAAGKHVIYFAGYGELGYQDVNCVRRTALHVLTELAAPSVLVHCGTLLRSDGNDGIAEVYAVAKELGFETAGIHPSVARRFSSTHRVSPYCDHVFFVSDDTWGGFRQGTTIPSQTLSVHLAVSDEIIVIGGGKHAADEMRAFMAIGKAVQYVPAEMNHATTREWCSRIGADLLDPRGAAHCAWDQIRDQCIG